MKSLWLFLRLFVFVIIFTTVTFYAKMQIYRVVVNSIGLPPGTNSGTANIEWLKNTNIYIGFGFLSYYAFCEEVIFRSLPLGICMYFEKSRKFWPLVAVISSVLFGLAHGNWVNIFLQGIGGLFYCLAFVFINRKNEEAGFVKATMVTTVLHALYNLVVVYFG